MKSKIQKWLLLIVGLLVSLNASAQSYDFMYDGLAYNINADGTSVSVTFNEGPYDFPWPTYSGDIVIPEKVTYNGKTFSVTSIGYMAFYDCAGLTSITIPNSVTSIGYMAFYDCTGLTSITIPNSVTSIEGAAFSSCTGLSGITIPNSVTSIGFNAFSACTGLSGITIPNSVTSIGIMAFSGCTGLTSITIPNSVTSIGHSAFSYCTGLTSIMVDSGNPKYDSRDNCNAIIETATNTLTHGFKTTVIPNSVTLIGEDAFVHCEGLTSIKIPNSVTSIGYMAFYDCEGLTSITIPNSVTSIGYRAFGYCTGLTSITIPNSVTSIGKRAFEDCFGLTSVTIGNSVTSIGDFAFQRCIGLTSVIIGNSVTSIGDYAFQRCTRLTSVYCKATTPPTASNSIFDDVVLVNGTLYIPNGSLNSYEAVDPWRNFFNIKETDQFPDGGVEGIESDGINVTINGGAIEVSGAEGERVEVYSLSGQCVYSGMETSIPVEKGIYIVRVAGTVHKVIL